MTAMVDEIYNLIRLDSDGARAALDRYNVPALQQTLQKLSEPIKLSFMQRIMAKTFSIDVNGEISRFTRLVKETLASKKECTEVLTGDESLEIGFYQQNLK